LLINTLENTTRNIIVVRSVTLQIKMSALPEFVSD